MARPKKQVTSASPIRIVPPSKKKPVPKVLSRTGVLVDRIYCRRCMKTMKQDSFFDGVDGGFLDANGKMSICKNCCNEIYENALKSELSFEKAMLKTCRVLNVAYEERALSETKEAVGKIITRGMDTEKVFSIYKFKLEQQKDGVDLRDRDKTASLTFEEPINRIVMNPLNEEESEEAHDLIMFWGANYEKEDYDFLETELAEWKKTHKCDTRAEETLLKEICHKEFDIRKDRAEGRDPSNKVKQLQELMKTANVDPAKTAMAGSGKSQDTFSAFIKTIENNEPAEYFEDKKLFRDFDNIDFYFKKYITRPLKNFITQSRDFNVDSESDLDEYEDFDIQDIIGDDKNE